MRVSFKVSLNRHQSMTWRNVSPIRKNTHQQLIVYSIHFLWKSNTRSVSREKIPDYRLYRSKGEQEITFSSLS